MMIELPNLLYARETPEPLIFDAPQRVHYGTQHRGGVDLGDTSMLAYVAAIHHPIRGRAGMATTAE